MVLVVSDWSEMLWGRGQVAMASEIALLIARREGDDDDAGSGFIVLWFIAAKYPKMMVVRRIHGHLHNHTEVRILFAVCYRWFKPLCLYIRVFVFASASSVSAVLSRPVDGQTDRRASTFQFAGICAVAGR